MLHQYLHIYHLHFKYLLLVHTFMEVNLIILVGHILNQIQINGPYIISKNVKMYLMEKKLFLCFRMVFNGR